MEAQRTLQKEQRRTKQREKGHRENIEESRTASHAAQGSAVSVLREQLTHHEKEAKAARRDAISSEATAQKLQMQMEHVAAERLEEQSKMRAEREQLDSELRKVRLQPISLMAAAPCCRGCSPVQ